MRKLALITAALPYRPLIDDMATVSKNPKSVFCTSSYFKLLYILCERIPSGYFAGLLLCIAFQFSSLYAQNIPHPSFRQYTTDEGLASSETFYILQDSMGYMWISTDNGVSRFDGYEFRNYGLKDGLTENVIFMLQLDTLGRLWMQAMSSNLYYLDGDVIHPYWNNHVLQNYKDRPDTGPGFIVEGAGETVHISTLKYGVITISQDGESTTTVQKEPLYNQFFEKNGKSIFAVYNHHPEEVLLNYQDSLLKQGRCLKVYFQIDGAEWSISELDYSFSSFYTPEVFRLGCDKYIYQVYQDTWLIENQRVTSKVLFPSNISYARLMNNGNLFLGLASHGGLKVYPSAQAFARNEGATWLPGQSVNTFVEDRDGGRWFATHEDGVFYAPTDAFMVYDLETGLPDKKVAALAVKNENEVYIGLENGTVWKVNPIKNTLEQLPEIPGRSAVSDLHYDHKNQRLWAAKGKLYYLENNQWLDTPTSNKEVPSTVASRIKESPSGQRLWLSNYRGFMSFELPDKKPTNISFGKDQRTLAVMEDFSGRVWVGKPKGLFEWVDHTLVERQPLFPAFSLRIEDMVLLPDSTVVIATKGGGVVFWKGEQFEQITTEQGLTADMLECLHADENGVAWAGTLNGLNRISGSWGNRQVEQISLFHGLPSNEINCIRTFGENVWVATSRGLVHFSNKKRNTSSPRPILASVLANKHLIDLKLPVSLTSKENNLTINYFALNYKMNGKIPYRYRMNEGDWTSTFSRSLNLPALPPGRCRFEIQAQNEDGVWSESTFFQFVIRQPWYGTLLAKSVMMLMVLFGGLAIYFFRTRQLKRAHQIQLQIADLERSALQAQMNPHFIFNCLNSIQSFILQNEKEAAIMYLGNFAALVRSMLNASVSGKILLAEEIHLLNNYLELEKLRFKNRFSYEIKTGENLDVFEIDIPPLLVQPYVENAVIHGISGRTTGGKVLVQFEKMEDHLKVIICDNGKGLKSENGSIKKDKFYKSFGMSITSRRLDLIQKSKQMDAVVTKNVYDQNGKVSGTEVQIKIGF